MDKILGKITCLETNNYMVTKVMESIASTSSEEKEKTWANVVAGKTRERFISVVQKSGRDSEVMQVDESQGADAGKHKMRAQGGKEGVSTPSKKLIKANPTRIMVDTKDSIYNDVLKKLQNDLPVKSSDEVIGARKSLAGDLVIKLRKDADGNKLIEEAKRILGQNKAKINKGSMVVVEVKGLDEETEENNVQEAIKKATGGKVHYQVRHI